ncbi:MAG: phage regulatory CII family protein [Pseudomonadota bacterium]
MSGKRAVTEKVNSIPLSPQIAFREVVERFGYAEMAAAIVMHKGTLQNKCNTDEDSHHKPTLKDVVDVTRVSNDPAVIVSLARMFGLATYELVPGLGSDEALLELLCKVSAESGAMHAALVKGYADKTFSLDDYRAVRAEAFDLISAVMDFLQRLEGNVDA